MTQVLQINSSLFAEGGQSTQLAEAFVRRLRTQDASVAVTLRDLATEPVPHLTGETFQAFLTPVDERSPEQQTAAGYSDTLIAELHEANVIVLGLPMYNFGVPSQLKAWFDHVARAGITFKYTENGPVGLLSNKKIYVFAARGGVYQGTAKDTQTRYVTDFFNFLGIDDIEFVYAEGLNMGDEIRDAALNAAEEEIQRLAA